MSSWVIVCKKTGDAIFETFELKTADKCRRIEGIEVVDIKTWLVSLNV